MKYYILSRQSLGERIRLEQIGLYKTEIGFSSIIHQSLSLSGAEIVQNGHIVVQQQSIQQMAADKSRPSGYEN